MAMPQRRGLGAPKSSPELLDMFFLDSRCALLEIAAALDRIERAEGADEAFKDIRLRRLLRALRLVQNGKGNRVEQCLILFSDL